MPLRRRDFIRAGLGGLGYFSTAALVPDWIIRSAAAIEDLSGENRILVIVQLEGGNDGLNTLVPYTDPLYNSDIRPTLHVPTAQLHLIDNLNGLHPALPALAESYGDGRVAIIQNVGYPNPDLSHFVSTDYWEQGRAPGGPNLGTQGWVGRFFDQTCGSAPDVDPLTMVGAGHSRIPGSLKAVTYSAPAIASVATYQIQGAAGLPAVIGTRRLNDLHALNDVPAADPAIEFIQNSANVAEASIAVVQNLSYNPAVVYPSTKLGQDLLLCSRLIHQPGIAPKVLHVRQAGYDTHADQGVPGSPGLGDHPALLIDLNDALGAFMSDLAASGNLDRVLILTFSEFGRRVRQNDSDGTDHGAASILFVLGGRIRGGVYGGQPNLSSTEDVMDPAGFIVPRVQKGNLSHTVDFRSVYARVIESWFGSQAAPGVFGQSVYDGIIFPDLPKIDFIRATVSAARTPWREYH